MNFNRISLLMAVVVLAAGCADVGTAGFTSEAKHKGMAYYKQGKYPQAAASFRSAARAEPREYQAQYYLGLSLDAMQQYQKALQAHKAALDVMQTTGAGKTDQAFREKIIDAIATDVARSDNPDKEIQLLKDKAKKSEKAEDYVLLARIYRHLGDPDSAIAAYKRATDAEPENPTIQREYAGYLNQLGMKQQAAEEMKRELRQ